eukprot:GEMP01040753.1.p1 GENE.GEMP01040753.1~~GEMP01040753.1.p1  ORF type:complete len:370 (+),score=66.24 GEMP01040753.1:43-1152(+)
MSRSRSRGQRSGRRRSRSQRKHSAIHTQSSSNAALAGETTTSSSTTPVDGLFPSHLGVDEQFGAASESFHGEYAQPMVPSSPSMPMLHGQQQQHQYAADPAAMWPGHLMGNAAPMMEPTMDPMDPSGQMMMNAMTANMMGIQTQQAQYHHQMQLQPDNRIELELFIADNIIGKIIGRGGSNLDRIRRSSGADVVVEKVKLPGDLRRIKLSGKRTSVEGAQVLFELSVRDAQAGRRPGALQQLMTPCMPGMITREIQVEQQTSLGGLIGRNGDTINLIREQSNVHVEIVQHGNPLAGVCNATVHIGPGLPAQVEAAAAMVAQKLEEGRIHPGNPRPNIPGENLWAVPVADNGWGSGFCPMAPMNPMHTTF